MAERGPLQELCEEATCSVCLELFRDPVSLPECGHSFCRACLARCWGESGAQQPACPQCRGRAREGSLCSNRQLASLVGILKKLRPQEGMEGEGRGGVCQKHREPLKFFCREDGAPLCLVCSKSQEHRDHQVTPLEEAAPEEKDARSTLQRYEEKESFENPAGFPPAPKWATLDFSGLNPLFENYKRQFKDTLDSGLHLQKANVTLDPDTAHRYLILSEGQKSVRLGEEAQALPNNPERFDTSCAVLGREGFRGGRHFWEVLVGSEGAWKVGVARKSVRRKGGVSFSPEGGFWAVGKGLGGKYVAFLEDLYPRLTLTGELKRVRVCLDYAGGRVAFFDADRAALLYEFSGASFSGETLLPLFWVCGKGHLRISS